MPDPIQLDEKLDVRQLLEEREATLRNVRDPQRSPYAAVLRYDFEGERPVVIGSAEDADLRLEGALPHHLRLRVEHDHFLLESLDGDFTPVGKEPARAATLPPGAVKLGRYTLRLSHQNFPAVVVLDPQSPALTQGPPPRWFEPSQAFRVRAHLEREPQPREELILSTRGNKRRALRLGRLRFQLEGKELQLTALRLLEPGASEAAVSIFFRDQTTGHESYPVGRYVDAAALPGGSGDDYLLDFNRAYNPACAFSPHYNCPIPPRENLLPAAVRAGERDPGGHAS